MATFDRFFDNPTATETWQVAYCAAVLECIAYSGSPVDLQQWAQGMGASEWSVVQTPGNIIPNFVCVGTPKKKIVAIPGTVNIQQMYQNVFYSGQRDNADFGAGRVHSFFLWCAEGIIDHVKNNLALYAQLEEVTFVGHSLGGAVVQLLADWIEKNTSIKVKQCICFNSPRVGNSDWAGFARAYILRHYFNSHDIICELPPPVSVGQNEVISIFVWFQRYVHRENLIRVQSLVEAPYEEFLKKFGSLKWPLKIGNTFGLFALDNSGSLSRAATAASRAALGALTIDITVFALEHGMVAVMDNLKVELGDVPLPERNLMETLRLQYPASLPLWDPATPPTRFGLVPPANFRPGANPGNGTIGNLPPVAVGERVESVNAFFFWQTIRGPVLEAYTNAGAGWADAILADTAAVLGKPLVANTQLAADAPPRPHWLFRGTDRRMLEALAQLMSAIDARDLKAWDDTPTVAISTREQVIPWDNDDLQESWAAVKDQISYCLSLYYAPE